MFIWTDIELPYNFVFVVITCCQLDLLSTKLSLKFFLSENVRFMFVNKHHKSDLEGNKLAVCG